MPKLSIIIVNYNTVNDLRKCLSALFAQRGTTVFQTILVDNNSKDESVAMTRKEFPQVEIIQNRENYGFAKANNIGMRRAAGKYCLLLNSDTEVMDGALDGVIGFLEANDGVGVAAPRVVNSDLSDQGVARRFPQPMNALFGRKTLLTRWFPNNRFTRDYLVSRTHTSEAPFPVDWVSGACMFIRGDVIREVGGLDEGYFMYWEDADWCNRIKKHGWEIYCVPKAVVVHHEGKSSGPILSNRLIVAFNRSAYRYYRKNCLRSGFAIMGIVAAVGLTVRTVIMLIRNNIKRASDPIRRWTGSISRGEA